MIDSINNILFFVVVVTWEIFDFLLRRGNFTTNLSPNGMVFGVLFRHTSRSPITVGTHTSGSNKTVRGLPATESNSTPISFFLSLGLKPNLITGLHLSGW